MKDTFIKLLIIDIFESYNFPPGKASNLLKDLASIIEKVEKE